MTKLYKSQREEEKSVLAYQGPWAGYGENMENGAITL
jgi:hypothetical protein